MHHKKPETPHAAPPHLCEGSKVSAAFPGRRSRVGAQNRRLMAATGSDHHVAILLEDDVGAVVEVEHRDGVELRGGAAGLGNRVRVDEVNLERVVSTVRRRVRVRLARVSRLLTRVCTMAWLVAFM